MNSLAIILTCACIHLLVIEIELLFGFTKIVKTLEERSNDKVEPQESEDKE